MAENTRRNFIKKSALVTLMAMHLPEVLRASSPYDSNPENKSFTFLFQGDSITDGNRGRNADPNHIMGHGYAYSIASCIGADFCKDNHHFINKGISGNTISDLEKRWQNDALDLNPDVISILVGINDVASEIDKKPTALNSAEFENKYRKLILDSMKTNSATVLVLCLPFVAPVGKRIADFEDWNKATIEKADCIQKLAKEYNAVLVNFPQVLERAIKKAPAEYWIWDGIHPTVPFHTLMAREWIKEVSKKVTFLKGYSGL
ncbi:Lysophospholipase L1 [Flavobacterium fluvii]|uniref:Lysophospholipase L1 n=1 Tax=Flavobacterium fluvii TaxID=468056 RepID=A0A1M5HDH3_9FLAO|nr:SGNH/GDSL hydrolase family protein [Flavobacterium fluvii]SHG14003.1 Lysophospholipase L1 [Flavobacterium fluvii]